MDDLVDRRPGRVVVGIRVDGDPQLAALGADHLIRQQRTTIVSADVENPRDVAYLPAHGAVIRPISVRDVPGVPLRRTRRSVSLKSGVNDRPRNGIVRETDHQDDAHQDERRGLRTDDPRQPSLVASAEPADERVTRVTRIGALASSDQSEHRRHEERDQQGRHHRHPVGDRDRGEERAERAAREEDGHEDDQGDQRSGEAGAAHLDRLRPAR